MAGTMTQGQDRPERQDVGARLTRGARDYWMVLRRHRVILFVTMALCLLAALLYILLSTPDYRATASVEVEDVPAGAAGAGTPPRPSNDDVETAMQTQLEVLRSRALAEEVARSLALVGTPTFFEGMGVSRPKQGSGGQSQRQVEQERVIALLRDRLEVELPGKSRVIRISFVSADPALSARIANGYADSLIRSDLKRGFQSGVQARRFLLGELDGARRDLERAERELAVYAARNGVPVEEGADRDGDAANASGPAKPSEGAIDSRLAQLNALRAQALAERIAAQKRWESARAASAATTLVLAFALMYTRSAMSASTDWRRSPSSSEHSILSSAIHVSRSCFLFCASTSFASSTDSSLFNFPRCKHAPKYCNKGELWPG